MPSLELQRLESRICLSVSFAPPVRSPVGPVTEMAAGDFNGDGIADLAVWAGSNTAPTTTPPPVRILIGDGAGHFKELGQAFAGTNVSDLEAADLNGDGRLDLVAANNNPYGTVTVLMGDGAGSFRPTRYFIGAQTRDVVVGDFDNNGTADIMAANFDMWSPLPSSDMPSRFGAGLLLGRGSGKFGRVQMIPLIDGQTHVVAGDVDHNGRLDAVFGGPFSMSLAPVERALVHVALNRPNNATTAGFVVKQFSPFVGKVAGLALSDLDANGLDDLAAVQDFPTNTTFSTGSATLHTFLSNGDGTFALKSAVNAQVLRPAGLSAGDLDRDGLVDFVITGSDPRPVIAIYPPPGLASVLLGTGGGGVAAPQLFDAGPAASVQALADANNDGLLDIVTGAPTGVSALLNTTTTIGPAIGLDHGGSKR